MEVFPTRRLYQRLGKRLLHVRGGVSRSHGHKTAIPVSSPRPWRCFYFGQRYSCALGSLLHVRGGVSLNPLKVWSTRGLLHVRGGVSFNCAYCSQKSLSSPRPWRCFSGKVTELCAQSVFSTSVEVFPKDFRFRQRRYGLLHVRGGVSYTLTIFKSQNGSSPRPWRCFA